MSTCTRRRNKHWKWCRTRTMFERTHVLQTTRVCGRGSDTDRSERFCFPILDICVATNCGIGQNTARQSPLMRRHMHLGWTWKFIQIVLAHVHDSCAFAVRSTDTRLKNNIAEPNNIIVFFAGLIATNRAILRPTAIRSRISVRRLLISQVYLFGNSIAEIFVIESNGMYGGCDEFRALSRQHSFALH